MLGAAFLAVALSNGPSTVALARCNSYNATQLEDRVRGFEKNPPLPAQRNDRYAELQIVLKSADDEESILHAICPDADYAPINAQLLATQAWALLLEGDLNRENYADKCPAAQVETTKGFVANAWLLIVHADPHESGKYPSVQTVRPKVADRAQALGLALPAVADTTNFWLSQVQSAANDAAKACPKQ
jgi:hypothetical protein